MTNQKQFVEKINNLQEQLDKLKIKNKESQDLIDQYENQLSLSNKKDTFRNGVKLYIALTGIFSVISGLLITMQFYAQSDPGHKLLFLSASFLIISLIILSLKWLRSSLSSLEDTPENRIWRIFLGCFSLFLTTTLFLTMFQTTNGEEKKVLAEVFGPLGPFRKIYENGPGCLGFLICCVMVMITMVNKTLKEDAQRDPLTPVDKKWISQNKFDILYKKIEKWWPIFYKCWFYTVIGMLSTYFLVWIAFWELLVKYFYTSTEVSVVNEYLNSPYTLGFVGAFILWGLMGFLIIFFRIFIWITIFFNTEGIEHVPATYAFVINGVAGGESKKKTVITVGKIVGLLVGLPTTGLVADTYGEKLFPGENPVRTMVEYPLRRQIYTAFPPTKPLPDAEKVYGSVDKIPDNIPKKKDYSDDIIE